MLKLVATRKVTTTIRITRLTVPRRYMRYTISPNIAPSGPLTLKL